MASIWKTTKVGPDVKVQGGLHPLDALRSFKSYVTKVAGEVDATVEWRSRLEAILRKDGQPDQLVYIELLSPPSAPEAFVPKRMDKGVRLPKGAPLPRGILVTRTGAHPVGEEARA